MSLSGNGNVGAVASMMEVARVFSILISERGNSSAVLMHKSKS
jgi:hypothetical protein